MTLLGACSPAYFLFQAGKGQLALLNRARPVREVIEDSRTDPELAALLSEIPAIKTFGESEGLKPTSNYREYVELGRDAVVYVVTVSEPLSFTPVVFRFPIVGSFSYIGWFDRGDAVEFAEEYKKKGMDIDVRGAAAYSTLGWFRDPLLSSMVPREGKKLAPAALPELVNVYLHESVHATVYVEDQSWFNESLASFVADRLTERYFAQKGLLEAGPYRAYLAKKSRGGEVRDRLLRAYRDLDELYRSANPFEKKLEQKKKYLEALEAELGPGRKITNATLIQFKTYDPGDHGFSLLLERAGGDVRRFLSLISGLRAADFPEKQMERFDGVLERL